MNIIKNRTHNNCGYGCHDNISLVDLQKLANNEVNLTPKVQITVIPIYTINFVHHIGGLNVMLTEYNNRYDGYDYVS